MKKLLALIGSTTLSTITTVNLISCKIDEFSDFPGNNQVAKTAAPAVISAVNNFLEYNTLYKAGATTADINFYYNYQNIGQNTWPNFPSLGNPIFNPWTNNDQGTAAVNSLAVALYTVTTLGNSKENEAGINGAVARIMPTVDGTLFQTTQQTVPTASYIDESMIKKAQASNEAKNLLRGYYQISGKAKMHQYGYSPIADLSVINTSNIKENFFTSSNSEDDIKTTILNLLQKDSVLTIDPNEVEMVINSKPSAGTSTVLAKGEYDLTFNAIAGAKTVQGTINFKISVLDLADFKFNLKNIVSSNFTSTLTTKQKVEDLLTFVEDYLAGIFPSSVNKTELEYTVNGQVPSDTKAALKKGTYTVEVSSQSSAKTVSGNITFSAKVYAPSRNGLKLDDFSDQISAPSYLNTTFQESDLEKAAVNAVIDWVPAGYKYGLTGTANITARPAGASSGGILSEGEYTVTITPGGNSTVKGTYTMKINVMPFVTNDTVDIYWAGVDIPISNISNG